jgi:hypothetical protein
MRRLDMDNPALRNHHIRVQVLRMPDVEEVVPKVKMGDNPHVGLAQSHQGRNVQDPQGVRLYSSRP